MNNEMESFEPLFIYISGPYSAPKDSHTKQEAIQKNVHKANQVALEIAQKGHFPFVPHTMMQGWEDSHSVSRQLAMSICLNWVKKCDALFFIATSEGAEEELKLAKSIGLPVFTQLNQVKSVL